jgi:lysophospholipid acyltransferase (LPLAT)-like uncharacterized protein
MARERTGYARFSYWFRRSARRQLVKLAVVVVPRIYLGYMGLVFATSRVRFHNFLDLHDVIRKHDGCVAILWHEEVFTVAFAYGRAARLRGHTLASHGDAGSVITRMLELCNFVVFRGGSSTKKSRRDTGVLKPMIEHMQENREVIYGITVDGSQGPPYRMKPGGLRIAQECGKPVVLVRTWYKRSLRLGTWDRTAIPLPFNVIHYYLRGPYAVPEDASTPEGFERFFRRIEDELVALARESYIDLGQQPPAHLVERADSEPIPSGRIP